MRIKFFRTKFSLRKSIKLILLLINSRNFRKSQGKYFILFFKRKKNSACSFDETLLYERNVWSNRAISINFWTFLNLVPLFLFRRLIAAWLIAHTVCLKSNFDVLFSSVLSLYDGGRPPLKFIKIFTAMKTISHARTFLINSIRLTAF